MDNKNNALGIGLLTFFLLMLVTFLLSIAADNATPAVSSAESPVIEPEPETKSSDNFEIWKERCIQSSEEDIDHLAAVGMSKEAKSLDDWDWVRLCAQPNSDLQKLAFKRMGESIANFETWKELCVYSSNQEVDHLAAIKMSKLAKSYDNWDWVRLCAQPNSDLQKLAFKKMSEIAGETVKK